MGKFCRVAVKRAVRMATCSVFAMASAVAQPPASNATTSTVAEMSKWVAQTGTQFNAGYQRDVQAPFDVAVTALRKDYLAAVVQAMDAAGAARKLDEADLFRAEREKYLSAGHKPPDDESDSPADAVKALRTAYRRQFAALDQERFNRARSLHAKCDQTLAQVQLVLTQRNRAADAALVQAQRDELAKAWLQPPVAAPALGNPAVAKGATPPAPEVTKETIRTAVEWVLAAGGVVSLPDGKDGKGEKEVGDVSLLPNGPTPIMKIGLDAGRLKAPLHDADLAPLAGLRSVRYFDFRGLPLTDAAFGFLDSWEDVEGFFLNASRVTDAIVPKFARYGRLRAFQLCYNPGVTGKTFDALAGLKGLRSIELDKSGITDEGLASIAQLKGVEELVLSRTAITNAGMVALGTMKNLRRLEIQETAVTEAGLASLRGLRDLEELGFLTPATADYAETVKKVAANWPKLRTLRFTGGELRAEHLEPLSAMRGLKTLHLQGVTLGAGAVDAIGKLSGLVELVISYTPFDDEQLTDLTSVRKVHLVRLNMNYTKITDAGLLKLKAMKGLREVEVRKTAVTAAGAAALEKDLSGCKVLR